jgi:hypothetical protein
MKFIVWKRQQRRLLAAGRRELVFKVRNEVVQQAKIDRWMERNGIAPDTQFDPGSVTG